MKMIEDATPPALECNTGMLNTGNVNQHLENREDDSGDLLLEMGKVNEQKSVNCSTVKSVRFRQSLEVFDDDWSIGSSYKVRKPSVYRDNIDDYIQSGNPTNPLVGPKTSSITTMLTDEEILQSNHRLMSEQDLQLDALGESISRQREISLRLGDELDDQVSFLEDVDRQAYQHIGRLGVAGRRMNQIGRLARDNWSSSVIIGLIMILLFLVIVLK